MAQVLDCIRQHSPSLVDQAQLVSHELIRMAILWAEMWHEVRTTGLRLHLLTTRLPRALAAPSHDAPPQRPPPSVYRLRRAGPTRDGFRGLRGQVRWWSDARVRRRSQGLEEASRLYFGESNVEGMLAVLLPLHEMMEKTGPTTLKEIAFVQAYGRCAAGPAPALAWLSRRPARRRHCNETQQRRGERGPEGTLLLTLWRMLFARFVSPPLQGAGRGV